MHGFWHSYWIFMLSLALLFLYGYRKGQRQAREKENLKKVSEDDKKRNWTTEGLAKFGEILRNNNDNLSKLSDEIISNLIEYLKSNQGGLYIINDNDEDEEYLELASCYAWDKKKYVEQKVGKGEGLTGQAWLERDTIYLTEVPDNYIKITSGLGEANPTSIIISPLKVNDDVFGIIELASFNTFEKYEIDFVEKVAESIASTISSVKINERTSKLLEESTELTEQMRAQEEEMRQNMEELQATQEEVARKSIELNEFSNAINMTALMIEFEPDGSIINVNEKFCDITHYLRDEILGKKESYYASKVSLNRGEYQGLWDELRGGENVMKEVERIRKDGSSLWLRASYMPVRDSYGSIKKIFCVGFDVTKERKKQLKEERKFDKIRKTLTVVRKELHDLKSASEKEKANPKVSEEVKQLIKDQQESYSMLLDKMSSNSSKLKQQLRS